MIKLRAERYRSGRNGPASKAGWGLNSPTWVRIPPSPPSSPSTSHPGCERLSMPSAKPDIRVVSDLDELERAGAGEMARLLRKARPQQPFAMALAGGKTPSGMYARLTRDPYRALVPWPRLHLFFGDERCVPPEHADS